MSEEEFFILTVLGLIVLGRFMYKYLQGDFSRER